MGVFSAYVLWFPGLITCKDMDADEINLAYQDVRFMFMAHCLWIAISIIQKSMSKREETAVYMKAICIVVKTVVYVTAFLLVEFKDYVDMTPEMKECMDIDSQNRMKINLINNYRDFERLMFYTQFIGILCYILLVRAYVVLKDHIGSVDMDDPFWLLVTSYHADLLAQDNYIMMSIVLIIVNIIQLGYSSHVI